MKITHVAESSHPKWGLPLAGNRQSIPGASSTLGGDRPSSSSLTHLRARSQGDSYHPELDYWVLGLENT